MTASDHGQRPKNELDLGSEKSDRKHLYVCIQQSLNAFSHIQLQKKIAVNKVMVNARSWEKFDSIPLPIFNAESHDFEKLWELCLHLAANRL